MTARVILGTHQLQSANGTHFTFELLGLKQPRAHGAHNELRIFGSKDGSTWWTVPMRLNLRSRIRIARGILATWPPENLSAVENDNPLTILFYDEHISELPVLPFDLDRESLWRATYEEASRTWSLGRVKALRTAEDWKSLPKLLPSHHSGWAFGSQGDRTDQNTPR